MSTEGAWWVHEDVVCLTFTRGRTVAEVLGAFGANGDAARPLTVQQARIAHPSDTGVVLRAGRLGEWTFCHVSGLPYGVEPAILPRLSAGTETVLLFAADGTTTVRRLVDGRDVDPGIRSGRYPPKEQVVAWLGRYLGMPIDGAVLGGPLSTVFLPDTSRIPPSRRDSSAEVP